jgi:hypothetical protein
MPGIAYGFEVFVAPTQHTDQSQLYRARRGSCRSPAKAGRKRPQNLAMLRRLAANIPRTHEAPGSMRRKSSGPASAADVRLLHHALQSSYRSFRKKSGTTIVELLVPLLFSEARVRACRNVLRASEPGHWRRVLPAGAALRCESPALRPGPISPCNRRRPRS